MKQVAMFWVWLGLGYFQSLCSPVQGAPDFREARTFEGHQHGQKQEGNEMQYASFTSITIVAHGQTYDIAGCVDPYHPSGEFFCGEGSIGKDGLIHFRWKDNFDQTGGGSVRFMDNDVIDFRLIDSYPKRILRCRPTPEYLNICTLPSHYAAHLPADYLEREAQLFMDSKGGNNVAVEAEINLYPDRYRLAIKGRGTWGSKDSLFFDFIDEEYDRGQGQIRFVGPAAPILTVHYSRNADKERLAKDFNKRQMPLKIAENRDK